MPPMCCLPTAELLDAPLPSPGSSSAQVPRLPRYYQGAMTSCRPSRRASLPSPGSTPRSARVSPARGRALPRAVFWSWSPGTSSRELVRGDGRISYVPGNPHCALALLFDPGRTHASGHTMRRRGPRSVHHEGSRIRTFEAPSHGFGTGCLRFAGRVTPTPRKTRFRLLARLFRTGSAFRGRHT
jgi:hypothetical protein